MRGNRIARYERKYFVGPEEVAQIRARIAPFVEADPFAAAGRRAAYTVRSIYYDTPDLRFYFEKEAGVRIRKKLRLRTYNDADAAAVAAFEIKRKNGQAIHKERVLVPLGAGPAILDGGRRTLAAHDLSVAGRHTLERFLFLWESLRLRPAVLVVYEREAYVGRDSPRVRVTLDRHVRSLPRPSLSDLHARRGLRYLSDRRQILELKYDDAMPPWLRPVTDLLGRSHRPISKYCRGIDLWGPHAL